MIISVRYWLGIAFHLVFLGTRFGEAEGYKFDSDKQPRESK